jgi:hypothetical protein
MADPQTFWLNVANVIVGAVVVACIFAAAFCIVYELIERVWRYGAVSMELNADMKRWLGSRHYLDVPHRR